MYAVIETGGKQYRGAQGDVLDVELARGDDASDITFERVLLVGTGDGVQLGTPVVEGAKVTASLVDNVRGPKIKVFKKKRRKGYKRLQGHRQDLRRVRVAEITVA